MTFFIEFEFSHLDRFTSLIPVSDELKAEMEEAGVNVKSDRQVFAYLAQYHLGMLVSYSEKWFESWELDDSNRTEEEERDQEEEPFEEPQPKPDEPDKDAGEPEEEESPDDGEEGEEYEDYDPYDDLGYGEDDPDYGEDDGEEGEAGDGKAPAEGELRKAPPPKGAPVKPNERMFLN